MLNQQEKAFWEDRLAKKGSGIEKLSGNCSACTGPEFKPKNQPLEEDRGGSRKETLMTRTKETE